LSLTREEWAERYRDEDTPWNHGDPHPEVRRLIAAGEFPLPEGGRRALVPGCGPAHDACAIAKLGFTVTGIDYTTEARDLGASALEELGGQLLCEDALEHTPAEPYDLVFEHTFLCAIDPADRGRYGELVTRALRPGGLLVVIVFPVDRPREEGGPPFTLTIEDMHEVLGAAFKLRSHSPIECTREGREWREDLAVFERMED
jgi:SAM-dependent methyltransferase